MIWTVMFTRAAAKARDKLPPDVRVRILRGLVELAKDPYGNPNVKALQGVDGFRLRVGDYRVIYRLQNSELVIEVIRLAHAAKSTDPGSRPIRRSLCGISKKASRGARLRLSRLTAD